MRFLSFHCEYFNYMATKRSRSKVYEELTEENKEGKLENVIVLFICVEKQDEDKPDFIEKCIREIEKIINQLKVSNIVILSFAHLFGQLSSPEFGLESLKKLASLLRKKGFTVMRPPFGWFNELEMKAKGHPLSRISRII
ncbi:MAG: threonyl-tRNA synthetase editing domain-containing protein [Promethearchaeota archaeon]